MRSIAIALLAFALEGSHETASEPRPSPCLVTSQEAVSEANVDYAEAATLLLRGLPTGEVEALADILESLVTNAVAKETDLYEDDGTNARADLETWMKHHAPEVTSAIAFASPMWQADDGFTVRLSQQCSGASSISIAVEGETNATARRARFLAWSVTNARRVPLGHEFNRTHTALVLSKAALQVPAAAEPRIRGFARTLVRFGAQDAWLVALAKPPVALHLPLEPLEGEALVVPNLLSLR